MDKYIATLTTVNCCLFAFWISFAPWGEGEQVLVITWASLTPTIASKLQHYLRHRWRRVFYMESTNVFKILRRAWSRRDCVMLVTKYHRCVVHNIIIIRQFSTSFSEKRTKSLFEDFSFNRRCYKSERLNQSNDISLKTISSNHLPIIPSYFGRSALKAITELRILHIYIIKADKYLKNNWFANVPNSNYSCEDTLFF